tara:strand:- start:27 stop:320 length:294 start_codon:yes stop_codon:yes gene_type:complete
MQQRDKRKDADTTRLREVVTVEKENRKNAECGFVVMSEWLENTDIIFAAKTKFYIYLKHLDGAPPFTIDELQIWEKCFNQIGVEKVGKYPSKRELNN